MQPGYPGQGQDPYGQQPPYQDPYGQPQPGQQPQYQDPYAQPTSGSPYPTSGNPYQTSGSPYQQPAGTYPQAPAYQASGYGVPTGQSNVLGIVGLVTGIVSLALFCCPYISIPVGIAGAITGGLGLKKANEGTASNRGMALAGLICGVAGVVIGIIILVIGFSLNYQDWTSSS